MSWVKRVHVYTAVKNVVNARLPLFFVGSTIDKTPWEADGKNKNRLIIASWYFIAGQNVQILSQTPLFFLPIGKKRGQRQEQLARQRKCIWNIFNS